MDETYVGGHQEGMQGGQGKAVVFGMLQRDGQVMTKVVTDSKKATLQPIIKENVKEGSVVNSDTYLSYKGLNKAGYQHKTVSHSAGEYVRGNVHTNGIEGFWKHLKGSINGTHIAVSKKHLAKYAKEFEFRFNSREKPSSMLPALLSHYPQTST